MKGGSCLFCIFLVLTEIQSFLSRINYEYEMICHHNFSLGCPVHESSSWNCAKHLTNCSANLSSRYHCLQDSSGEPFQVIHICAPPLVCDKGTVPIYDKRKNAVNCELCHDGYYQPFKTWSDESPSCIKKHACDKVYHKIECDMDTELRNTQDVYCRCDARNNYILLNSEISGTCFPSQYGTCYEQSCPDGQERLLNYSCVLLCPQGQKRDDNDICVPIGIADQNTTYIKVNKIVADIPDASGTPEISDLTSRKVTIRWKHSLTDNNSPISTYIVTIKSEGYSWEDGQLYEVSSNTCYIIIKDLQPINAYQVRVTARNAIGLSPPSNSSEIFFTLPESTPDAPGTPEISDLTSRKVTVRWKHSLVDNNSPITSYIVTIKSEGFSFDDRQIYEVSSNTSYIIITDLTPNTAYQVRVTARNAIGLGPPSSPSEIFFTLPERSNFLPLQLAAHSVESDKIEISWKAPPSDTINGVLQGYEIQYGIFGGNVMTTITVDGTKESVVIRGMKPFTNYRIAVRAFNNANRGPAAITYVRTEEERIIDHTTTSVNQDQDLQTAGTIDHTTTSINQDMDIQSTESPFIRYLLYIIPGIGFIVGVGLCLCLLKKFKCWPCVDGVSNNNPRSNSDINSGHENLQLQNSSQQYWTIVSNSRGEVSTALETNINMEVDENIYRSHHNHAELEGYIHPIHSDSLELDQSYSSSVEFDGYIDPIPSEHVDHDGYIHPIPSEPVEHDVYIHPVP